MLLAPTLFAPALVALALAATPAPSAAEPSVREQVEGLLGVIHGPVPVDRLRALGPEALDVLADVAVKPGLNIRRARALDALAALGGGRAEAAHRAVLDRPGQPRAVRRVAVRGLGQLAGRARAAATLSPYLDHDPDPAVRAAAAETLAAQDPGACGRVRARARAEQDASRFAAALRTCERAGAGADSRPRR